MASHSFSQQHEDIKLTKEEAEFLEKQFLKYLQKEMEKNSSNWEEYYDILKEEFNIPFEEKMQTRCENESSTHKGTQKPYSSTFKVNPEKTKQQYKEDIPNQSKWQTKNPKRSNEPKNVYQGKTQAPKQKTKRTESKKAPNTSQKNQESKKTPSAGQKSQEEKSQNNEKPSKTETEEIGEEKKPTEDTKSLPLRMCRTVKYVVLIFLCFVLLVLTVVLYYSWLAIKFILKYAFIFIRIIASKVYSWLQEQNQKRKITKKLSDHINNTLELFHLLIGIDLKRLLSSARPSTTKSSIFDDIPPPALPESSLDAIHFLSKQNAENPYRVLCVRSKATVDEIKTNYRKLVRLVHPDKCDNEMAAESFRKLDAAFKRISDVDKRKEVDDEIENFRVWEEYNRRMGEKYENLFEELKNSIHCTNCNQKHRKTLIKERKFDQARYCEKCKAYHFASDGDVWAEIGLLGINWRCFVCIDAEVFDVTKWAICQNLKATLPTNDHRVYCRLGTQCGQKRRSKEKDDTSGKSRKGKRGKRRK